MGICVCGNWQHHSRRRERVSELGGKRGKTWCRRLTCFTCTSVRTVTMSNTRHTITRVLGTSINWPVQLRNRWKKGEERECVCVWEDGDKERKIIRRSIARSSFTVNLLHRPRWIVSVSCLVRYRVIANEDFSIKQHLSIQRTVWKQKHRVQILSLKLRIN